MFKKMIEKNMFGQAAMWLQLAVILATGYQAFVIWDEGSAGSVSLALHLTVLSSCVAYAFHAWFEKKNWFVFLPQIPAIVLTLVVIGQIIHYTFLVG
jgi:hypothetical protein